MTKSPYAKNLPKLSKEARERHLKRLVESLMFVLDPDMNFGIKIDAPLEIIEFIMQSDSPFAGYVLSCLVPPEESKDRYEQWVKDSLLRTMDDLGLSGHGSDN